MGSREEGAGRGWGRRSGIGNGGREREEWRMGKRSRKRNGSRSRGG